MKKYNITMKTPIGLRYGTMEVNFDKSRISGNITLLGHTRSFDGTVDKNGNCSIKGNLITLMRDINITATGKIDENEIDLSVVGDRNIFKITGSVAKESEEDNNE